MAPGHSALNLLDPRSLLSSFGPLCVFARELRRARTAGCVSSQASR